MLLRSTNYSSPIDVFACGCIMAELLTLRPLFPGSSEADQIYKICSVLGTPTMRNWPEGIKLAAAMNFRLPQFNPTALQQLIPHASADAIAVITDCLKFDPNQRPTTAQILQYPFFQLSNMLPVPSAGPPAPAERDILDEFEDIQPAAALPAVKPLAAAPAKPAAAPTSYASLLPSVPSVAAASGAASPSESFLKPARYAGAPTSSAGTLGSASHGYKAPQSSAYAQPPSMPSSFSVLGGIGLGSLGAAGGTGGGYGAAVAAVGMGGGSGMGGVVMSSAGGASGSSSYGQGGSAAPASTGFMSGALGSLGRVGGLRSMQAGQKPPAATDVSSASGFGFGRHKY